MGASIEQRTSDLAFTAISKGMSMSALVALLVLEFQKAYQTSEERPSE